jgi:hypothetical protein
MYRLKFDYTGGGLPVLTDSYGNGIYYNGYIIGSKLDPHWKPYNKKHWPSLKNQVPLGTAVTDFDWGDGIHFGMYQVGNIIGEPIPFEYSKLLGAHFDTVHKYSQESFHDQLRRSVQIEEQVLMEQKQAIKERIKQVNALKKEAQQQIEKEKKVIKEYEKVKNSQVRYLARSENMSKERAGQFFDQENAPQKKLYDQAQYQISVYTNNILIAAAELKELKKLV